MVAEDATDAPEETADSLEGWLDAKAEELGVSRERLLTQLGAKNGNGSRASADEELAALRKEFAERLSAAHDDLETEFESELDDARSDFDEKIDDVRDRVIQVKREADGKADADHDHPELHEETEQVAARAEDLTDELESLSASVAELEEQVETGFDNYEDVLEYLTDATDDLQTKLTTLAEATVGLRDQTKTLAARHATRAAADELAHLANRRGVESAVCGHCDETVHIGLLAAPKCPHCASQFSDVERKQSFFGSHTLVVGEPPALEGERAEWDIKSVMEADSIDPDGVLDEMLDEDGEGDE
ncbi:hypothetical protein [Halorussus halophilus]|uniref:hypothetical protein n=1 Tax=Halorussus halophilus TaxID=2650975 RepID=UPI001300FADE|nr:hypothetical protein [Halorussus halophilus]